MNNNTDTDNDLSIENSPRKKIRISPNSYIFKEESVTPEKNNLNFSNCQSPTKEKNKLLSPKRKGLRGQRLFDDNTEVYTNACNSKVRTYVLTIYPPSDAIKDFPYSFMAKKISVGSDDLKINFHQQQDLEREGSCQMIIEDMSFMPEFKKEQYGRLNFNTPRFNGLESNRGWMMAESSEYGLRFRKPVEYELDAFLTKATVQSTFEVPQESLLVINIGPFDTCVAGYYWLIWRKELFSKYPHLKGKLETKDHDFLNFWQKLLKFTKNLFFK